MSTSGLRQFDETLHLTNTWLKDIMTELGWSDRSAAYRALRTSLHSLRDHLSVDDGAHLAAQLPMMLKGVYYDGWKPAHCGGGDRSAEAFLKPIGEAFDADPRIEAKTVAQSVFKVMSDHITEGEINHVRHALPKPIREIFADA
ncbi:MAG: DUF2267 domain-containing protein [Pseudomonadota bacterium]